MVSISLALALLSTNPPTVGFAQHKTTHCSTHCSPRNAILPKPGPLMSTPLVKTGQQLYMYYYRTTVPANLALYRDVWRGVVSRC